MEIYKLSDEIKSSQRSSSRLPSRTSRYSSLSSRNVSGDVVSVRYSALKKVSVIVDDDDVQHSEIIVYDDYNGEIRIQTRPDAALLKQRAFLIFTIDGYPQQDWRLLSFDSSGKAIISDIK